MLGVIDSGNTDLENNFIIIPPKYNRSWGTDYMLMDGNSFIGGIDDKRYEKIIEMFVNIWNNN